MKGTRFAIPSYADGGAMGMMSGISSFLMPFINIGIQEGKKAKARKEADKLQKKSWETSRGLIRQQNLMESNFALTDGEMQGVGQVDYYAEDGGRIPILGFGGTTGNYYDLEGNKERAWLMPTSHNSNRGYGDAYTDNDWRGTKNNSKYTNRGLLNTGDFLRDIDASPFAGSSGGMKLNSYDGSIELKPGLRTAPVYDHQLGRWRTGTAPVRTSWKDVEATPAGGVVNWMAKSIDSGVGIPIGTGFMEMVKAIDKGVRKKRGDSQFDSAAEEIAHQNLWANQSGNFQSTHKAASEIVLDQEEKGSGNRDYYAALGGRINTVGGMAIPVDEDTYVMKGDTHQEDTNKDGMKGITLVDGQKPIAEVEDGEVLEGDKVHSNRIKTPNGNTIADEKMILLQQKQSITDKAGKLMKKANETTDKHKRGSIARKIMIAKQELAKIEAQEKNLYNYQQQQNGKGGYEMAYGGRVKRFDEGGNWNTGDTQFAPPEDNYGYSGYDTSGNTFTYPEQGTNFDMTQYPPSYESSYPQMGSNFNMETYDVPNYDTDTPKRSSSQVGQNFNRFAGMVTPFIDNIYNAFAIENTPDIPKPYRKTARPYNTRVDVSRQITKLKENQLDANKDIDKNTGSSSAARTQKMKIYADSQKMTKDILGEAADKELAGRNKNIQLANELGFANIDTMNTYSNDVFNSLMYKQDQRSKNVANAVEDANQLNKDQAQRYLDKENLGVAAKGYSNTGVIVNSMGDPTFDSMVKNDPEFRDLLWSKVKGNSSLENRYISLYGKRK